MGERAGWVARRLVGCFVAAGTPGGGGLDPRRVDARRVHLLQQLVLREGRHLPMVGIARLAARPDVNLRIDDLHGSLLTRLEVITHTESTTCPRRRRGSMRPSGRFSSSRIFTAR